MSTKYKSGDKIELIVPNPPLNEKFIGTIIRRKHKFYYTVILDDGMHMNCPASLIIRKINS